MHLQKRVPRRYLQRNLRNRQLKSLLPNRDCQLVRNSFRWRILSSSHLYGKQILTSKAYLIFQDDGFFPLTESSLNSIERLSNFLVENQLSIVNTAKDILFAEICNLLTKRSKTRFILLGISKLICAVGRTSVDVNHTCVLF